MFALFASSEEAHTRTVRLFICLSIDCNNDDDDGASAGDDNEKKVLLPPIAPCYTFFGAFFAPGRPEQWVTWCCSTNKSRCGLKRLHFVVFLWSGKKPFAVI